jgi:uncharacterized protein (TIGR02266 family)
MSSQIGSGSGTALRIEYLDGSHLLYDWKRHISRGGTFVRTEQELAPGAPLSLKLSFPGLLAPIVLPGVVRAVRAAPEPGVQVAITFADDEARAAVASLVERAARGDPQLVSRRVRLLLVEDNPHVITLITEGLREAARRDLCGRVTFEFETASDGAKGLEKVRAGTFDVVLTDVYLPVMDGPQLIRELRGLRGRGVPILALSAGGESARDAAMGAGADLFVEKPLRLAELVGAVRQLLAL